MAETAKENTTVGLADIATRLPALLIDAPAIVRGFMTGFMARPTAKTSIGKVFQERAARYGGNVFIKFEDETLTYRQANEAVNRYAAVLAARGVGRGDVVGIMLKNPPRAVLLMLAVVKLGAIAGMVNYNQRGKVVAHSVDLLGAKVLIGEDELLTAVDESGAEVADAVSVDELERLAADAPTENPAVTSSVLAKDKAFYIFTSGTTGMPKVSVRKVPSGEPGLLLSKVSNFQPFDGYTDSQASEKKLVRDAFRDGDVWFNTGDLMRSPGFGHAAFADRLGDTFRWKGENVATTEVEHAVNQDSNVEECTVYGVAVEGAGGKAGMAAIQLEEGTDFDGKALAKAVYEHLPGHAVPLFVRIVESREPGSPII
jgi:acyl-CoA synthetase (AMP-forming)/AMP-acid ligase II